MNNEQSKVATPNSKLDAVAFGEHLRKLRENKGISLMQVTEQLQIRSYLLNDMEKGRFAHLRLGDCLAYAKLLGADLKVVKSIHEISVASKEKEKTQNSKFKLYLGIFGVVVFLIIFCMFLTKSSNNNDSNNEIDLNSNKQVSNSLNIEEAVDLSKKAAIAEEIQNNTDTVKASELNLNQNEFVKDLNDEIVTEELNNMADDMLNSADNFEGSNTVVIDETVSNVAKSLNDTNIENNSNNVNNNVVSNTVKETTQAVNTVNNEIKKTVTNTENKVSQDIKNKVTKTTVNASKPNVSTTKTNTIKQQTIEKTKVATAKNNETIKNVVNKNKNTQVKVQNNFAPKATTVNSSTNKKPLKLGEIRSLAEEMGVKPNNTQKSVKTTSSNNAKDATKKVSSTSANTTVAPKVVNKNLKSGQIKPFTE